MNSNKYIKSLRASNTKFKYFKFETNLQRPRKMRRKKNQKKKTKTLHLLNSPLKLSGPNKNLNDTLF